MLPLLILRQMPRIRVAATLRLSRCHIELMLLLMLIFRYYDISFSRHVFMRGQRRH